MTTAPANLKAVRALMLQHLDIHESSAYPTDLDPAEVGIVGDPNHWGGYHCGSDRVVSGDYSVVESSRDRGGLAEWACALDVGSFSVSVAGKAHNLRSFSIWLVSQCKAGTVDTRDIREVIYSPDGRVVKRWDRLGIRSSGDGSHLWHTHISYHRDAIKAGRDLTPLYRRWLTDIGLLAGEDDDMVAWTDSWPGRSGGRESFSTRLAMAAHGAQDAVAELRRQALVQEAILAAVKGLDTEQVIAHIDQRAAEEAERDAAAARERAALHALVERGQSGELDAAEVVRLIGERLSAAAQS